MVLIYEGYHSKRKMQKSVILDNNFTYGQILLYLRKYGIKNKAILDIGCGVGTIDFYMAKEGARVLGIDISKKGIDVARQNAINLKTTKNLKLRVLDFPGSSPPGKFDIILCLEVLEHIKEDMVAIGQMYKMLKRGGIIIASSPLKEAPLFKIGLLKQFDKEVGHLRRYSPNGYIKMFQKLGLKILETKKTEGIIRNFLFTTSIGGLLLRVLGKRPLSKLVSLFDSLTIPIFGGSNIYLVAQKQ